VQGVGIVSSASISGDEALATRIEKAMSDAVKQAQEDGVDLNSPELQERMRAARQKVLDESITEEEIASAAAADAATKDKEAQE
jgi:hypothetical protein